jgi:hypothetical protein
MGFHFIGLGFALCMALYFLPTIIGWHKRNVGAIFVVNLFFGWTLVGWVVALVWALTADPMMVGGPFVYAPRALGCGCGAPLLPNQRFCGMCGARIGWPGTHA